MFYNKFIVLFDGVVIQLSVVLFAVDLPPKRTLFQYPLITRCSVVPFDLASEETGDNSGEPSHAPFKKREIILKRILGNVM